MYPLLVTVQNGGNWRNKLLFGYNFAIKVHLIYTDCLNFKLSPDYEISLAFEQKKESISQGVINVHF